MADPIVLADNRFLDGTPTATDTAAGYDVLNIRDLKEFTSWKAASAGTKYLTVDCLGYTADALGIKKHNLSTAAAAVSVESSNNGTDWTQRLAPFTPANDKAILKLFTLATGAYWRVKIVTVGLAPQIAVCMLGERITFPFSPDAPYVPASEGIESESIKSKTGVPLGSIVRFKPYRITPRWTTVTRSFVETYFLPFWNDYASNLSPFFFAWDLTAYPSDVRFVSVPKDYSFETPVSVLAYYDSITLPMEGVKE
jgi:hypothetical protein